MKKLFALALAVLMLVSMVACASDNEVVQNYVDRHGDELIPAMEQSFATASGMTCQSTIEADGNGIVVRININELNDLSSEQKEVFQNTYDAMGGVLDSSLSAMQQEVPEIEYFEIVICEADGDEIATIHAGE